MGNIIEPPNPGLTWDERVLRIITTIIATTYTIHSFVLLCLFITMDIIVIPPPPSPPSRALYRRSGMADAGKVRVR